MKSQKIIQRTKHPVARGGYKPHVGKAKLGTKLYRVIQTHTVAEGKGKIPRCKRVI